MGRAAEPSPIAPAAPADAPVLEAPVLEARGLAVGPPGSERVLIADVELTLGPGEGVALTGPSGAGKTTLLRTLAGQIPPRAGAVTVAGAELAGLRGEALRAARSRIGFIAQQHDLVPPLPVYANVMAGALGRWSNLRALRFLMRPNAAELAEAERALTAVGLAHKLRAPTGELSGGEQQRVAIARALVQQPRLLLADEPVASLDPATAREILGLLTELASERGVALVCTLHQPELAERYFGRVLDLRDGALHEARRG